MKKFALLIGICNYDFLDSLRTPLNDVDEMKIIFENLGFEADVLKDSSKETILYKLAEIKTDKQNYDATVFYYAGHGCQIKNKNYICPKGADNKRDEDILSESCVAIDYIFDQFEQANIKTKIFILDSCRNIPQVGTRGYSLPSFSSMVAPLGSIISFSTSPLKTAKDYLHDTDSHSPYEMALSQYIEEHDIPIEEVFKRTRIKLWNDTEHSQLSWEHSCLLGDFYFSQTKNCDELQTDYSLIALADATFNYSNTTDIVKLINKLRSHDYYKQNPAIQNINSFDFSSATKEELFVLGRNLYQCGCDRVIAGNHFFYNLNANLSQFPQNIRFHILNGMAYEIFFNSQGTPREKYKTNRLTEIMTVLANPDYKNSAYFIKQKLLEYPERFFYDPYECNPIEIFITVSQSKDSKYYISEINIDSINVLNYRYKVAFDESFITEYMLKTKEELQMIICNQLAVPPSKAVFRYTNLPKNENFLRYDIDCSILRK